MNDKRTLAVEMDQMRTLLAGTQKSEKGMAVSISIARLYKKYFEEEKLRCPTKGIVEIQVEFASFFGKSKSWAMSHARLNNLAPPIVAKALDGLPCLAVHRLATYPPVIQESVLKRALELAAGTKGYLWVYIEKAVRELKGKPLRNKLVSLQMVPNTGLSASAAQPQVRTPSGEGTTAAASKIETPLPDPVLTYSAQNEAEAFIAAFKKISQDMANGRINPQPRQRSESVPQWLGECRVIRGRQY